MKYIICIALFVGGVLAVYYMIQLSCSRERKYIENWLMAALCMASAAWSFGISGLVMQQKVEAAYICHCVGMAGAFLYMVFMQALAGCISGIPKRWQHRFNGIALSCIPVYFLTMQKSQIGYDIGSFGMTSYLKEGIARNSYVLYFLAVSAGLLAVTGHMLRRSDARRIQAFGRKILFAELLLASGSLLDCLFPKVGVFAILGSSLTQCWGMVILYYATGVINHSRINIMNMSEFIYYSLAMPVLVYDPGRMLHIMNDAAATFFGVDRDVMDAGNSSISQFFSVSEEDVFCFGKKHQDVDAVCKKNQVYCSLAVSKIDDVYGDTIGYIIIVTDLSERRKAIQELEEAKYEAEAANHAKSTFLAKMSHEIRTPMNAVIGFSELALKSELQPQVREYVEDIKNSSQNLLAIINDILDISKIESGRMELVCGEYYPAGLFQDVYLVIDTQVRKKGLEFRIEIDPDIPRKLHGDKIRIRSILINLLNNAVKYTQQGSIFFQAGIAKKEGSRVTLEFRVGDTGSGIREEEKGRLFETFSQLDQKTHYGVEGTGLGLAIVKGYVTLMGGHITVDSEYGKGSVFTATVEQEILDAAPLDKSFMQEDESRDEFSLGNLKIQGVRVLVVDDNQVNLKVVGSSMGYYGLKVDKASSGAEAVRLCQQNRYQMVFMDQMMPQMDGVEAMRRIRSLDAYYAAGGGCKMIVLTANAVSGVRDQLMEQGFDEYLGKPMNCRQLERLFLRFLPKECIRIEEDREVYEMLPPGKTQGRAVHRPGGRYDGLPAQETEMVQQMLPQVEVRQGIQNCGGHLEDYLDILQAVYSGGSGQLEELSRLQQQGDYGNYIIQIHAVKGAALNIGAKETAEMARKQEQAGKDGDNSYIDGHLEEFRQDYQKLLDGIREVLVHYGLPVQEPEEARGRALSEQEAVRMLQEISGCIDEFDYARAAGLLRAAGQQELPGRYKEAVRQAGAWMEEMDTDKIQQLFGELAI